MTHTKRRFWIPLLISLLLTVTLAACGGSGAATEPADEAQPTTAATSAPETGGEEATEEPTPPPTTAPTESTSDDETVEVSGVEAQSLLDVESINSFRLRLSFNVEGEAFPEGETGGTIEGAFTGDPRANHLVIQVEGQEGQAGSFEVIQIEDQIYVKAGGQWIEAPAGSAPQLETYYLFGDELEAAETVTGLERVGQETLSGRQVIHYRGNREFLIANQVGGSEFGIEGVETVQYDIWIDKAEGFPVKQTVLLEGTGVNAENPEAVGRVEYTLEYYDFNADITIEAPQAMDLGGG